MTNLIGKIDKDSVQDFQYYMQDLKVGATQVRKICEEIEHPEMIKLALELERDVYKFFKNL
jgi:hypothetical protein